MTIPYDYDQTNIDHLRAVIDEQEQTIKYLHERCKAEEVVNAKLRELVKDMWHLMDGSGVTTGAWGRCVRILDRMRELGMEVDG